MAIPLSSCLLRPFRPGVEESLARSANNRRIWKHLRDQFPHPYTLEHAEAARVLEKAGYVLEGRLRQSVFKDGVVLDSLLYAFVR